MTIDIRPYQPGDELKIEPVEGPIPIHPEFKKKWDELVRPDLAWSSYDAEGRITGLGGIVPYENDAYVWIILDKNIPDRFRLARAFKDIVRFAESFKFSCLWTYIQDGFGPGHKLAKFLGFVNAGKKENGCYLYLKEA